MARVLMGKAVDDLATPYAMGQTARTAGVDPSANPFDAATARARDWARGWREVIAPERRAG